MHTCFTSIATSLLFSRWCESFTTSISECLKAGGVATAWMIRLCSKMGFSAVGKKSVMVATCATPGAVKADKSTAEEELVPAPLN